MAWQLRNAENKPVEGVAILGKTNVMDIEPNNNTYECVNKSLVFGKNISNGTYYLVPMFATNADGSNNWKACANSSMYIKLKYQRQRNAYYSFCQ